MLTAERNHRREYWQENFELGCPASSARTVEEAFDKYDLSIDQNDRGILQADLVNIMNHKWAEGNEPTSVRLMNISVSWRRGSICELITVQRAI
jgi:hypothetical protein